MNYLFINTSTKKLIVSIIQNEKILFMHTSVNNNDLSKDIMSIIDKAFKEAKLTSKDINTIFVSNGPGSFTGIRIGLTIAKVMAWSLKIKVVPISSLELMASKCDSKFIVPLIDARRGYVFAALYDSDLNKVIDDKYILYTDFINEVNSKKIDYTIVSHDFDYTDPLYDILKVIKKHINDEGINPHKLNPNYLKLTEAEERFNEGG